jgi:hypothetical protein
MPHVPAAENLVKRLFLKLCSAVAIGLAAYAAFMGLIVAPSIRDGCIYDRRFVFPSRDIPMIVLPWEWLLFPALIAAVVMWLISKRPTLQSRRRALGLCPACGYDLHATADRWSSAPASECWSVSRQEAYTHVSPSINFYDPMFRRGGACCRRVYGHWFTARKGRARSRRLQGGTRRLQLHTWNCL